MSAKHIFLISITFFFFLSLLGGTAAYGEIIKISLLKKEMEDFSYKRDIFSPVPLNPVTAANGSSRQFTPPPPPPPNEEEDEAEADLAEEIRQSVVFEGYIIKDSRSHALLNINGEYFVVGEGDMVMEKMKVVEVGREGIKVEAESMVVEILLKGDENEQ